MTYPVRTPRVPGRRLISSLVVGGAMGATAIFAPAATAAPSSFAAGSTASKHQKSVSVTGRTSSHASRSSHSAPWQEGKARGPWELIYHGYGTATNGSDWIGLSPMPSTRADETHGGLVASVKRFNSIDLTATLRTDRQLRTGTAPNPWESAWLLWHHTDDLHFYALALKPNGWELSKEDPAYPGAQRYLATGASPRFPIGSSNTVRVRQQGARMRVEVNGKHLATFTDRERPYTSGQVGLYTEDAQVTFSGVRMFGAKLPTR